MTERNATSHASAPQWAASALSHAHLDGITLLQLDALRGEGRVVAHDLVHADARRERDALLNLLGLEARGGALALNDHVTELADLDDLFAGDQLRQDALNRLRERTRKRRRTTISNNSPRKARIHFNVTKKRRS